MNQPIWNITLPLLLLVGFLCFRWGWRRGIDHSIKVVRRVGREYGVRP